VLFDAGGTLVTLDYPFIADLVRRRGFAVELDALPRADGQARLAIDRAAEAGAGPAGTDETRRPAYFSSLLRAAGVEGAGVAGLADEIERAHVERNLWRLPQPGALDALRGLRSRGVRTAVVSNSDGRIGEVLAATGMAPHLELVVDSHYEGVEKPDPEIFRRALARLGVGAERCAYVGDIYSIDVLGARGAGLEPVIIDPTGAYGPLDCAVIAGLGELLEALGDGGRRAP
jgi:putative hydrolase of the HAD superfamily